MSNVSVSGGGDTVGPATSTDNAVARFDGTTGNIQDSGVLLNDTDQLSAINQITLDVGAAINEFSIDGTMAGDSDTALPTEQAVRTYVESKIVPFQFGGNAVAHEVNTTTGFAPVSYEDFGDLEMRTRNFDTTTTEYMEGNFRVPDDIDSSGSVTFELVGSSETAVASKNVKYTFDFIQVAAGGVLTGSYGGAEIWDDQPVSATQDAQDTISNSATVSTLGWIAGRDVYYRVYRSTATSGNLATDYRLIRFNGLIARA